MKISKSIYTQCLMARLTLGLQRHELSFALRALTYPNALRPKSYDCRGLFERHFGCVDGTLKSLWYGAVVGT